jgi:hypothetical protein
MSEQEQPKQEQNVILGLISFGVALFVIYLAVKTLM